MQVKCCHLSPSVVIVITRVLFYMALHSYICISFICVCFTIFWYLYYDSPFHMFFQSHVIVSRSLHFIWMSDLINVRGHLHVFWGAYVVGGHLVILHISYSTYHILALAWLLDYFTYYVGFFKYPYRYGFSHVHF